MGTALIVLALSALAGCASVGPTGGASMPASTRPAANGVLEAIVTYPPPAWISF